MTGFLIVVIVLIICVTIIIREFLQNADNLSIWDVQKGMREINNRLQVIEEDIRKLTKGGVDHE